MWKLLVELRRRSVFRSAGIYVGTAWILIEGASVILPTFNAPDAAMRWLVISAIIGFPIAMVLAWVFDISERGILVTDEGSDTVAPQNGVQKMDFVAIGALSLALIFSTYLNMRSDPAVTAMHEPISILIADFDNNTGNSLLDGVLEQIVAIGLESAPFIARYDRASALSDIREQQFRDQQSGDDLDIKHALMVADHQDIDLVVGGVIEVEGTGYRISIGATYSADTERLVDVSGVAKTDADVFESVDVLVAHLLERLGADSNTSTDRTAAQSFAAVSLGAASHFAIANNLVAVKDYESAMPSYLLATEIDPNFGRAFAAATLCAFQLGDRKQADQLWARTQTLLDTMSERERFRMLGQYHAAVSGDLTLAFENFASLVDEYPADASGYASLASTSFLLHDYGRAVDSAESALAIFPNSIRYRLSHALYAMYAGRFDVAESDAQRAIETSPSSGDAYLPLAAAALARDDHDAARDAYRQMATATSSESYDSLATLGLSDVEIYAGNFGAAKKLLRDGIESDLGSANEHAAAIKHLGLALVLLAEGQPDAAEEAADQVMQFGEDESRDDSLNVPAAMVFIQTGANDKAEIIAANLQQQAKSQSRAYGLMLSSMIHRSNGDYAESRKLMRRAINVADLWLIRFQLGQTFLASDQFVEALDEFTIVERRLGEATAVFLDAAPTYRYFAAHPYWTGRAQDGLNMQSAATESYEAFLKRWSGTGPLMDDARSRLSER